MAVKQFVLLGDESSALEVDVDASQDFDTLIKAVATNFGIYQPTGVDLCVKSQPVTSVDDILSCDEPIAIAIDGKSIREPPGPDGLPYVGNYYEVFPDHIGNHQRMFDQYGPVFKETIGGKSVYQTNDPEIGAIAFSETEFFSKKINENHPLAGLKNQNAGVVISDTHTEAWKLAHKFLPPAFGPKAVRHYTPVMQGEVEASFKIFDELDEREEAWNAYQYMLKISSSAVGKLVLGIDFDHFSSVDAPLNPIILNIADLLMLNKKISAHGAWYSSLPFGDPKKFRELKADVDAAIDDSIEKVKQAGTEDLELQDAALKASCVIDYAIRAVDNKGNKLPKDVMIASLKVATAAGFTTTSSLLSWLMYGLVTYPGMQERLLQELVDHGFDENTQVTADLIEELHFLNNYVKEMQRLHNPAFQPARTALRDVILPGGYKIPKDGVITIALHHIHNNTKVWENPTKFDPDRWDTEEVKSRHKSAYMPFAQGPRSCIGFNFALQEIKIFLPKLVYRYKFERSGDASIEYDPMFQLIRPVNLYLRARKRVKWPPRSKVAPAVSSG